LFSAIFSLSLCYNWLIFNRLNFDLVGLWTDSSRLLGCSIEDGLTREDFNHPNFGVVKYLDSKSEERREYRLSYKGFMAVAMSFTGKEAGRWKEKFIQAFETAMEIYERARSGDITLADQIANLATDEQTKWLIARQTGKVMRNQQTNVLKEHGVYGIGYAMCTNNTYRPLLGGTAKEVKEIRGLPVNVSLRDNLSMEELTGVTYAETITLRKIQEKNLQGNLDCAHEHLVVAEKVAEARR